MKENKASTLRRLLRYLRPHGRILAVIFLLLLVMTQASLLRPKLLQEVIDRDISVFLRATARVGERNLAMERAGQTALFYLSLVILSFVVEYLQNYLLQQTGQRILYRIRQEIYEHILNLPMSFFDQHPLGSLVTRVTNDTEAINEMFTTVLRSLFQNFFSLIGIMFFMYRLHAKLALYIIGLLPLIVLVSVVFRRSIRKIYSQERRLLSQLNTKLAENLAGIRITQMFHRQKQRYEDFMETNEAYKAASQKEVLAFGLYRPALEAVRCLGWAAIFWVGGHQYLEGWITFGVLYAFVDYLGRFFEPILQLAETYNIIQSASTSAGRIFSLLDETREELGGTRPVPEGGLQGKIEFEHVWFAYREEEWVLKDVSFCVEPGEFIAFVGATGAGKSTIMHLLCGFYPVNRGTIRIDGVDLREYRQRDLRRAIGVVQQEVFLFRGDILGNLTMGRADVSEEAAREAARLVNAEGFIRRLKGGYHAPVAERGATLSAGQRQLLSFARTIAAKPSVLVLDEATANIDTETERLIQEAIQKMAQQRTMIAVAHRLSTIVDADRIFVMHQGRLAESGTREELLQKEGLFSVLYQLQYQGNRV